MGGEEEREEGRGCWKKACSHSALGPLSFYLIYLFLVALGLRCCAQALSSCGEQLLVAVRGLPVAVVSLAAEHALEVHGFGSCSPRAQQLWGKGLGALQHVASSWIRD